MADISITAASFLPSANATILDRCLAGATLTRGMPVYYESSSGTYKQLDLTSASKDTLAGFCIEDVAVNQYFSHVSKDPALAIGGTCASGDTIWCSQTGITKTIGDLTSTWRIIVVGVATASGVINFDPIRGGIK
jgi:hypothetical protein